MNAKTAVDNNSSLGAGSEKQTQHQATGSVSLGTKGRAACFLGLRKREREGVLQREFEAGDSTERERED